MTVRSAYKVEELLALRHSASESAVSLDKFHDEDAIKEHVLKPSASNPGFTTRRESMRPISSASGNLNTLNTPLNTVEAQPKEAPPPEPPISRKKPSPTPSIKRGKAQRLLKEHGSPPGVRVTAGGRIVTTDFTPLGSPRYIPPHFQRQRASSRPPYPQSNQDFAVGGALPNGFVAYNIEGQLCQMVNGNLVPLQLSPQGPILFMPSSNYPFPALPAVVSAFGGPASYANGAPYNPQFEPPPASTVSTTSAMDLPGIEVDTQVQLLRKQYEKLKLEKIEHERREVKIKDKLPLAEREMMVQQKRQYINDLDKIRKTIKQLEDSINPAPINPNEFRLPPPQHSAHAATALCGLPPRAAMQNAGPFWAPMNAYNNSAVGSYGSDVNAFAALNPEFISGQQQQQLHLEAEQQAAMEPTFAYQAQNVSETGEKAATDPGEASTTHSGPAEPSPAGQVKHAPRKSHAIPIKDPRTGITTNASVLDPTSPAYEPGQHLSASSEPQPTTQGPSSSPPLPPWHDRKTRTSETLILPGTKNASSLVPDATTQPDIEDTLRSMLAAGGAKSGGSLRTQHDSKASFSSAATGDMFVSQQEHSLNKYMERVFGHRTNSSSGDHGRPSQVTPGRDLHYSGGYPKATVLPSPNSPFELRPPRAPQPSPVNGGTSPYPRDHSQMLEIPAHFDLHFQQGESDGSHRRKKENSKDIEAEQRSPHVHHAAGHSTSHRSANGFFDSPEEKNEYFDGYRAGSAGHAPRSTRSPAYVSGYCDGLMKARTSTSSRSLSTVSVKSDVATATAARETATPPQSANKGSHAFASAERHVDVDRKSGPRHVHCENLRTASQGKVSTTTPTKHQPWGAGYANSPNFTSAGSQNHGFEQRVLSGSMHNFEPAARRAMVGTVGGNSDGSGDTAIPMSATKLYHDAVHSTNVGAVLSERSVNLGGGDRGAPGPKWVQTEISILRVEEVPHHVKHKVRASTTSAGHGHPGRHLSLSYDGANDDPKSVADGDPGHARSPPSKEAGKLPAHASSPVKASNPAGNALTWATAATPAAAVESDSSPTKSWSPRRHSPTKARLGRAVRSVFSNRPAASRDNEQARSSSPDPAKMNPEEKRRWKKMWRETFAAVKEKEQAEMDEYRRNNPVS